MRLPHLLVLALTVAAFTNIAYAVDGPRKPNFVYVFTDDQRWDALGAVQREQGEKGRFPWLKTPGGRTLTYLDSKNWSQKTLLRGTNGLAALTFCAVPITP